MLFYPKSLLRLTLLARGGDLKELDVNLLVKSNELVIVLFKRLSS